MPQENPDGSTTLFIAGGSYEVVIDSQGAEASVRKYYAIGGQRVMREDDSNYYLLTDHLGSVVGIADGSGTLVEQQRYLPYGIPRLGSGFELTDFGYTGQRSLAAIGLMDYNARWYAPSTGAFTQADTLALPGSREWGGYAYASGNPVRFADPTGNRVEEGCGMGGSRSCDIPKPQNTPPQPPEPDIPGPKTPGSSDDPADAITDMLMGEGGSTDLQMAADILMVLFNRMVYAWMCNGSCQNGDLNAIDESGVSWGAMTADQFSQLAVYVASLKGTGGVPAFNAWGQSQPRTPGWAAVRKAVAFFLANGHGTSYSNAPILIDTSGGQVIGPVRQLRQDVKYYYSWDHDPTSIPLYDPHNPEVNGYVYKEKRAWQLYFYNPITYDPSQR